MTASPAIRAIKPDDVAALSEMIRRLGEDSGERPDRTATAEELERHGGSYQAVLAEIDGAPVGYCLWCRVFSTWRGRPGLYVVDLYVDAGARTRGLGRRLLAAAIRHEGSDAAYVMLDVHGGNRAAFGFYETLGFDLDETSNRLVLDGASFSKFMLSSA